MTVTVSPAKFVLTEVNGNGVSVDVYRDQREMVMGLLLRRDTFALITENLPVAQALWDAPEDEHDATDE